MSQLEQIQKLRDMTGAGMMDCKKALQENDFDIDKAIDFLRQKGKAKAAKRAAKAAKEGIIFSYIHPGDKIGVLLEVNCETDFVAKTEDFKTLAKEVAMHIAATDPRWLKREEVAEDALEREKDVIKKQLAEQGKPAEMIDKIVAGKLGKFYSENCLLEQAYIRDDQKTINEIVEEVIAKLGENIQIGKFARFKVGQ
jgi:elongation factor Ts